MRWNCPHCGTSLAIADEKTGNGWSFSRCYKCAGFALVRRSDVTLIKVDRAPEGEPVLLPEAHENPTTMLSQTATRNLARYSGGEQAQAPTQPAPAINVTGGAKPVIRTAAPRTQQSIAVPPPASAQMSQVNGNAFGLPEPLPEEPARGIAQRLTPFAIGIAGMITIGSGIYLYMQGQALFEKARAQAAANSTNNGNDDAAVIPQETPQRPVRARAAHGNTVSSASSPEVIEAPSAAGSAAIPDDQIRSAAANAVRISKDK